MKMILCIAGCLLACVSLAQTEFGMGANSTLTSFRGNGTRPLIFESDLQNGGVSNYGSRTGLSWGIYGYGQRFVSHKGWQLGFAVGYERLRSRNTAVTMSGSTYSAKNASTTYGFANLFPYLGKRFTSGKQAIDIDFGPEIALPISAVSKVDGESKYKSKKPDFDYRLRLDVKWQYGNIGLLGGYSLGVMDYQGLFGFGDRSKYSFYSNVIRFGAFYRLAVREKKVLK